MPCTLRPLLFLALACAVFLTACENKLTATNFAKIKTGMSLSQVESILGSGTDETASGATISSSGVLGAKSSTEKTYVWKSDKASGRITVIFKDGKVVQMSQIDLN